MVLLSFGALVVAWHVGATIWPSRSFPAPLLVLQTFISETASGDLPYNLGITLCRVAASAHTARSHEYSALTPATNVRVPGATGTSNATAGV